MAQYEQDNMRLTKEQAEALRTGKSLEEIRREKEVKPLVHKPPLPINHPPGVDADNYEKAYHNTHLPINFIDYAYDIDQDPLRVVITKPPKYGTLTKTKQGYDYTPHSNFVGEEIIRYKVNDGQADSPEATLHIVVSQSMSETLWPWIVTAEHTLDYTASLARSFLWVDLALTVSHAAFSWSQARHISTPKARPVSFAGEGHVGTAVAGFEAGGAGLINTDNVLPGAIDQIRAGASSAHIGRAIDPTTEGKVWLLEQFTHTVDQPTILQHARSAVGIVAGREHMSAGAKKQFIAGHLQKLETLFPNALAEFQKAGKQTASSLHASLKAEGALAVQEFAVALTGTVVNEAADSSWAAENIWNQYGIMTDTVLEGAIAALNLWTVYNAATAIYHKAHAGHYGTLALEGAVAAGLHAALIGFHDSTLFSQSESDQSN
jgi:hypothetical protein